MARIFINDDCIGCGACVAGASDFFEFNDEGLAETKFDNISKDEADHIYEVINECPTDAIILEEN